MLIEKIKNLTEKRIDFLVTANSNWYEGSKTYFDKIQEEVHEAEAENKENNSVYLEDELGDIFWDYFCLLFSLKEEGKITDIEKIFERCYKKFSERIGEGGNDAGDWNEIKERQKEERKEEYERKYLE